MNQVVSSETVTRPGGGRVAVAKAQTLTSVLLLLALPFLGIALLNDTTPNRLMAAAVVAVVGLAVFRASRMGLFVSRDSVDVVNFLSQGSFDRSSVQIEFEGELSQWPGDDIPAAIRTGVTPPGELSDSAHVSQTAPSIRALYVGDDSGERIRVNVVPSYGDRANRIVEDLRSALDD